MVKLTLLFFGNVTSEKSGGGGEVNNRIQELRKERRITQSELADAVDVTRQTIISLENGRYRASLVLAHKIAQYFGMRIEDIFIFDLEEENVCCLCHQYGDPRIQMRNTGKL